MRPLKIALVTTFYPPYNFGGDGIYIKRLALALIARGHYVEVIHDTDGYLTLAKDKPEIIVEQDDGIVVRRLTGRSALLSSLGVQQTGRPTTHRNQLKALLTNRFDVIHYHNISLVGGPGIWAVGTGIKLHTAHEHWLVCPSHTLWKNGRELCKKKSCISCVIRSGRPPQLWRATGLIERMADSVDVFMTLSQSAADNHRRFGFKRPMVVVPSFLLDEANPTYQERQNRRPYFLFAGRLETIKGLQDIIPQFVDGIQADLLIAGAGEFENELRKMSGGAKNIRFLGRQDMSQLRTLYRDAIAVLTPSLCYEVFPLVVLEAFREGTPIIARDLGPFPEIIRMSGGGQLFNDRGSLNQALTSFSQKPEIATNMGKKAKAAYLQYWTENVAMEKYFEIIQQVEHAKQVKHG